MRARLVTGRMRPAARQLAFIARRCCARCCRWRGRACAPHGRLPSGGVAAIAYGSFGGDELGFGSDLDLVFLYDEGLDASETDGARPLEAVRYHTRVVQKVIALLAMATPAGRLYETDLRLRPDGAKGLLVSSLQSFSSYQHERAWTWEQQALVRARAVAGDAAVQAAFERIRAEVLCRPRPRRDGVRARDMRQRIRAGWTAARRPVRSQAGPWRWTWSLVPGRDGSRSRGPGVTPAPHAGADRRWPAAFLQHAFPADAAPGTACCPARVGPPAGRRARRPAPTPRWTTRAAIKAAWQNCLAKPLPRYSRLSNVFERYRVRDPTNAPGDDRSSARTDGAALLVLRGSGVVVQQSLTRSLASRCRYPLPGWAAARCWSCRRCCGSACADGAVLPAGGAGDQARDGGRQLRTCALLRQPLRRDRRGVPPAVTPARRPRRSWLGIPRPPTSPSLGILALLGAACRSDSGCCSAIAVLDDLGAIVVIMFYTDSFDRAAAGRAGVLGLMYLLNLFGLARTGCCWPERVTCGCRVPAPACDAGGVATGLMIRCMIAPGRSAAKLGVERQFHHWVTG